MLPSPRVRGEGLGVRGDHRECAILDPIVPEPLVEIMQPMKTSLATIVITVLLMTWSVTATRAAAGDNYAFLVAVGDYDVKQLKPLAYTRNDVLEFSKALTDSGFKPDNIVLMHDDLKILKSQRYLPSAEKIRKEFDLLLSTLGEGDSVIVAFAGHGVQFEGDDRNFFCPVDADLEDPKRERLISLKEIYTKLEECPADRKLLLVDACRNDPLSKLARSRDRVKLNSVTRPQIEVVPKGIVALFSCSAGQESYEWPELRHGVFFHHILSGWKGAADNGDQELSLDELLAYTRKSTQDFARTKLGTLQTPQSKGEFNGTWVLKRTGQSNQFKNSIGMTLKLIPEGKFLMGSTQTELERHVLSDKEFNIQEFIDEQPQHQVHITKPFYFAAHETTQSQYQQVMGTNPGYFSKSGAGSGEVIGQDTSHYPVESVSWFDAIEFCIRLSGKENRTPCYQLTNIERSSGSIKSAAVTILDGNGYRLPTEAEWEYACRAKSTTPFHFGSKLNGDEANVDGKSPFGTTTQGPAKGRTMTVGSYPANVFGLCDMHGNVWEWCEDWYQRTYYDQRFEDDPQGPASGDRRVLRGGSWISRGRYARSARRKDASPSEARNYTGFRVVCISSTKP